MAELLETIEGVPNLCGEEDRVADAIRAGAERPAYLSASDGGGPVDFGGLRSACAVALHMHQPLIPAGGGDLSTAAVVSNLQYMLEHPDEGDNHNASVFHWCYKRMGEFVPQLLAEGKEPRVMLEYSGTLFHGLRRMGLDDVLESLQHLARDPSCRRAVEWLGAPWGHAVAPSTPVLDYRLHVRAWQHHFASIFGLEALSRVRGFSPSEMALPNHPDIAFEFVRTLRDCGYQWVLVQEHTVEEPESGHGPQRPHLPHRLVCTSSRGEQASILAIVKTQGSDTKLVAQMQPWFEARSLGRLELGGQSVPPLVTQIADGENGGVMMNEFPSKYLEVVRDASGSEAQLLNASEYLEYLFAAGIREEQLPVLQPLHQKRIWERVQPGDGPERLDAAIEALRQEDHGFHVDGGSWTNDISWVRGYENVLGPMEQVSALFHERTAGARSDEHRYRNALYHLLTTQTSCYRYWGQGLWTEYARELCRRTREILAHDFAHDFEQAGGEARDGRTR